MRERGQQPEFDRAQMDARPAAQHLAIAEIDGHVAEADAHRIDAPAAGLPPQVRTNPRGQLGGADGATRVALLTREGEWPIDRWQPT